jgi:light-regulated signal transduction histidine kinase (bacteriophytochrome)
MEKEELSRYMKHVNGDSFYQITVADNGIGFDAKQSGEIFKVFKRLHSYHEYEGTGVGLSICKKIIEKHGGFITAESELDKGASFIIGLPVSQQSAQPKILASTTENIPVSNPT